MRFDRLVGFGQAERQWLAQQGFLERVVRCRLTDNADLAFAGWCKRVFCEQLRQRGLGDAFPASCQKGSLVAVLHTTLGPVRTQQRGHPHTRHDRCDDQQGVEQQEIASRIGGKALYHRHYPPQINPAAAAANARPAAIPANRTAPRGNITTSCGLTRKDSGSITKRRCAVGQISSGGGSPKAIS